MDMNMVMRAPAAVAAVDFVILQLASLVSSNWSNSLDKTSAHIFHLVIQFRTEKDASDGLNKA